MAASKSQLAKQNFRQSFHLSGVFYRTRLMNLLLNLERFVEIGVDKSSSSNIILLNLKTYLLNFVKHLLFRFR